ncbi:hypothetical protein KC325_g281 [Hortaea werneckii]|nr:hypothetical protein KC325_g281 [Hortaea werneckii]
MSVIGDAAHHRHPERMLAGPGRRDGRGGRDADPRQSTPPRQLARSSAPQSRWEGTSPLAFTTHPNTPLV